MSSYDNQSLYTTLSELEVIDKNSLDQAFRQAIDKKIPLDEVLLEKNLISDENLGKTISEIISSPLVRLQDVSIPPDVLNIIPEIVAKNQQIIAFKKDQKGLSVAMNDPGNILIKDFIEKKTGLPVVVYFATKRDIAHAIRLYSSDLPTTFDEIVSRSVKEAESDKGKVSDSQVINIVDAILRFAYQNRASDIHIEPEKDKTLIRFRIDGVLHDVTSLSLGFQEAIIRRIKEMSGLKSEESNLFQDGKLKFRFENEHLDVRVSIVPITIGEKAVLRLLSYRSRQLSLTDLGLSPSDFEKVKDAYSKHLGMILSTGPTGSGATTIVYTILKILNKRDVNIMTIEDPVEYDLEGINQIEVNEDAGQTFATGLRSIVKQDPDIIFVGEIKDAETAGIAVSSVMTGHIVLSTVHTNDSSTLFPMFLDMNIDLHHLASSVNIVIAQRLVRKIHSKCRVSEEVDIEELTKKIDSKAVRKIFGNRKKARIYKGKGCEIDHGTGFDGRVGVFEVLVVDDEIKEAIIKRSGAEEIKKIAIKNGMTTMIEDGLEKIREGITTFDELVRATRE